MKYWRNWWHIFLLELKISWNLPSRNIIFFKYQKCEIKTEINFAILTGSPLKFFFWELKRCLTFMSEWLKMRWHYFYYEQFYSSNGLAYWSIPKLLFGCRVSNPFIKWENKSKDLQWDGIFLVCLLFVTKYL